MTGALPIGRPGDRAAVRSLTFDDVVAFTHLRFDHAGWAFANGAKTFPNARYVMAEREWAPYVNGEHGGDITTPRPSLPPATGCSPNSPHRGPSDSASISVISPSAGSSRAAPAR